MHNLSSQSNTLHHPELLQLPAICHFSCQLCCLDLSERRNTSLSCRTFEVILCGEEEERPGCRWEKVVFSSSSNSSSGVFRYSQGTGVLDSQRCVPKFFQQNFRHKCSSMWITNILSEVDREEVKAAYDYKAENISRLMIG